MSAHTKLAPDEQMTIEEFLAYTDTRPDGERWELIEGVAIMSPSPVDDHQTIVANLLTALMLHRRRSGASWRPMPGIGTLVPVSPRSLPQPDIFVKETPNAGLPTTSDALVLFEVLSRSNTKADQAWRRRVYASVPNCRHYVTVSLKALQVTVYDRDTGWKERTVIGPNQTLDLPAIGFTMPLAEIYLDTTCVRRERKR